MRFTSAARSKFTKIKVVLYKWYHTGKKQPFFSVLKFVRLHTCRTEHNIHPFVFRKCFPAVFDFVKVYVRHLYRCELANMNWCSVLFIFFNKFIFKLHYTPNTTTKKSIILLHIIRVDRYFLYSQI